MKRVLILAIFSMVLGWCCLARATAPTTCLLTGTLADIYGVVGAPYRVHYKSVAVQNAGSNIIPGASSCSVLTDNAGNLPSTGTCTSFVQNSIIQVQVGSGPPVQIQIPTQASADLSTLILANTDPPSIVSQISIGAGGDYVLTVTNPSAGTVGQAILGPGNVTGWAGQPIPTGVPTSGAVPYYTAGPTAGWQWGRSGTWTPIALCAGFTPTLYNNASNSPIPASGYWVQIGNMVYVQAQMSWGVATTTATANALALVSLPFTPVVGASGESNITISGAAHPNLFNLQDTNIVVNPPIPTGTPVGIYLAVSGNQGIATLVGGIPTATSSMPVGQPFLYGSQFTGGDGVLCAQAFANQGSALGFSGWYRIF